MATAEAWNLPPAVETVFSLLLLSGLAFLPSANIINVLCRHSCVMEKRGGKMETPRSRLPSTPPRLVGVSVALTALGREMTALDPWCHRHGLTGAASPCAAHEWPPFGSCFLGLPLLLLAARRWLLADCLPDAPGISELQLPYWYWSSSFQGFLWPCSLRAPCPPLPCALGFVLCTAQNSVAPSGLVLMQHDPPVGGP